MLKTLTLLLSLYIGLSICADKEAAPFKAFERIHAQSAPAKPDEKEFTENPALCGLFKSLSISIQDKEAAAEASSSSSSRGLLGIIRPIPRKASDLFKMPAAPCLKPENLESSLPAQADSGLMLLDMPALDLGQPAEELPAKPVSSRHLFERKMLQVKGRQQAAIIDKINDTTYELKNSVSKKRAIRNDD